MEEKIIDIREDLQPEVRRIDAIRQHLMGQLNELGQELRKVLKIGHGVDIAEPGWRLDAEGGKLAYVPQVAQVSQPAEPTPEPEQEG